jgi:hypothetical protein
MIDFIKNNQKHITTVGAIALLILCYFQRKEIATLRGEKDVKITSEIDTTKVDSLKRIIEK